MRQVATKWLSHIAIGACNNTIMSQESRPRAFIAFFVAVQGYLCSQVKLVAIQCEICMMREKNDTMRVSVGYVRNACVSHAMCESWEPWCACSCVGVSISYVESLKFEGGTMVDMVLWQYFHLKKCSCSAVQDMSHFQIFLAVRILLVHMIHIICWVNAVCTKLLQLSASI